ncbi:MAG: acyl carrier protein [Clostridiales bacterium]|nr:acyl carrier protein [Clostridiales bacterium]
MDSKILNKVIELIEKELKLPAQKKIDGNTRISELNMDSISFINLIITIEKNFEFEFDDEKLIYTSFKDILSIADYVELKI